jgi:hypothetical protein
MSPCSNLFSDMVCLIPSKFTVFMLHTAHGTFGYLHLKVLNFKSKYLLLFDGGDDKNEFLYVANNIMRDPGRWLRIFCKYNTTVPVHK